MQPSRERAMSCYSTEYLHQLKSAGPQQHCINAVQDQVHAGETTRTARPPIEPGEVSPLDKDDDKRSGSRAHDPNPPATNDTE